MAAKEERPYLPSCWENDAKMTAFFIPFRTMMANPEGLTSKIIFWKTCIDSYCRTMKKCTFTEEDILKAFTRNGRTPRCISNMLEEMMKSREIYELNTFLQIKPINEITVTWPMWALQIGKKPVSWTWNKVRNAVWPTSPAPEPLYVHKQAVQDKAQELLEHTSDLRGRVVQIEEIIEKCNWPKSGCEDALLAVYWLYCQDKAAVFNFDFTTPSKVLVKLATNDQTKVSISDTDICKFNLLKLCEKTEARIAEYEEKCNQARDEARKLIVNKRKVLAMSQLKKKKIFEGIIHKEANILNNIHSLLETLNHTELNKEVIEALKTTNAAIKLTQEEADISEGSVLDLMDDLRDTIEMQENINSTISQSVGPEDNEDLEQELNDLLEDDICKWVENLKLPDLSLSPKSYSTATTRGLESQTS